MVGVPGKYKGCETCRRRRVKVSLVADIRRPEPFTHNRQCSNERPYCSNCVNSGRQCEGYERERVFITGTPETKGRVASHPKKTASTKRSRTRADGEVRPHIVPVQPLTSAWDDYIRLSNHGIETSALLTALQTNLQGVSGRGRDGVSGFEISLPAYGPAELQPNPRADEFSVKSKCLANFGGDDAHDSNSGYCAFLFEVIILSLSSDWPWKLMREAQQNWSAASSADPAYEESLIRSLGPKYFTSFPNHQYFVRVHRPLAVRTIPKCPNSAGRVVY